MVDYYFSDSAVLGGVFIKSHLIYLEHVQLLYAGASTLLKGARRRTSSRTYARTHAHTLMTDPQAQVNKLPTIFTRYCAINTCVDDQWHLFEWIVPTLT